MSDSKNGHYVTKNMLPSVTGTTWHKQHDTARHKQHATARRKQHATV